MDNVLHVNLINNNELRYIYPLAKCLVLPSKLEVFGMVLLEAMYLGAPVLSSRNGGAVTLIPNDNYGQVIDNYNEDLWVKAISRYIDDETYSDLIIKNAHERVVNDFTWDSIVAKMVGIAKEAKLL